MKKVGAYENRGGDTRRLNSLRRLVDENGGDHVAKLLVEVLKTNREYRDLGVRIERAIKEERSS